MGARTVTDCELLDRLAPVWERAAGASPAPMRQREWTLACARSLERASPLAVRVVETNSGVAIAPLVRRPRLDRLELAGVRGLHEPMDFPFSDRAALDLLVNSLASERVPLRLARVPAWSTTVPAVREAYGPRAVRTRAVAGTPAIDLDESWIDTESRLSARRRSDLRRARRRADTLGEVRFELLDPTPAELAAPLDEAFAVEARGWKGRTATALADDPERRAFFELYARAAAERGELRIALLRIDGRAAAMQIAIEAAERFWLLKIGYDESYARASPGHLLLVETLRLAASRRLRSYEFLGAPEPWTGLWTKEVRPCVDVRAYPGTPRTVPGLARDIGAAAYARWQFDGKPAARAAAARAGRNLSERAARGYAAGPTLGDALEVGERLAERELALTLCYWDSGDERPADVAAAYRATAAALGQRSLDAYASGKATALAFDRRLAAGVLRAARAAGVALHFDAMAPASADPTLELLDALAADAEDGTLGCTLPGRWTRSAADAERAIELGLRVRVVKGQWDEPDRPGNDAREGFRRVVAELAGRAVHVAVATHDVPLLGACLDELIAAGTPCEAELLYGLPLRDAARAARARGAGVRVYVPYGRAWLPYAVGQVRRNPRIAWWVTRDLALGRRRMPAG